MQYHLTTMGVVNRYKLERPSTEPKPHNHSVNTLQGVQRVLGDMRTFKTIYSDTMNALTDGYGFFLCFDDPVKHAASRKMIARALWKEGRVDDWTRMYEVKARELIRRKSYGLSGVQRGGLGGSKCVDVVRDVVNIVPVHWICGELVSAFTSMWLWGMQRLIS